MLMSAPKGAKSPQKHKYLLKSAPKVMFLFVFYQTDAKSWCMSFTSIHHLRPRLSTSRAQPTNLTASVIPATAFHHQSREKQVFTPLLPENLVSSNFFVKTVAERIKSNRSVF